jgi:hypothetical protein
MTWSGRDLVHARLRLARPPLRIVLAQEYPRRHPEPSVQLALQAPEGGLVVEAIGRVRYVCSESSQEVGSRDTRACSGDGHATRNRLKLL